MKKLFTLFTLALLAAFGLGGGNVALAETVDATVKMTYIDGSDDKVTTSFGEVTEAVSGCNKLSGGKVELYNKSWGVNKIVYVKVDASSVPENATITKVTLKANVSGSTDSKRVTVWGVGYNSSVWSSSITWNTADRSITTIGGTQSTKTKSGKSFEEKSFDITEAFTNENETDKIATIIIYETAAAGGNIKNVSVSVEYSLIPQADFTVKYVCNGEEIKNSSTLKGSVDSKPVITEKETGNFLNTDNTKKYIYVSDDSESKTISQDGTTVVTVTFREAATYSYSLVSDKGAVLNSGSNFEGETLSIGFPRYYFNKSDSTLYEAQGLGDKKLEYRTAITLDANNKQVSVDYKKSTKNSIAFYTEGEDIAGATDANAPKNIPGRASNARAAKTKENLYVTSLPAGKYIIHVGCFTYAKEFADKVINLGIDDKVIGFTCSAVNLSEVCSDEIVLSKTKTLKYLAEGSADNAALDYLYIEKTGNVVESNGEDFIPGDGPTYDPDKAPEGGIESATRPEHGMATSPSDTTQNDNTNGTATGINGAEAEAQIVSIVNVNGAKVNSLQKGINIVTYSNGKRVKIMK